jgi:hypothetical protein
MVFSACCEEECLKWGGERAIGGWFITCHKTLLQLHSPGFLAKLDVTPWVQINVAEIDEPWLQREMHVLNRALDLQVELVANRTFRDV